MSSTSPRSSSSSDHYSPRSRSPSLAAIDSTSPLILLPDSDDATDPPFDFSDDDDDDDYELLDVTSRPVLSLSSLTVFLYLLSPYISLGALLLPSTNSPFTYGVLVLFAALSAFVRQIWYMLARYMRSSSMEDIVVDAFAKGRGKETRRRLLRNFIRFGVGFLRILLATIYLSDAVHILLPFIPQSIGVSYLPTRPILTLIITFAILPLSFATLISSKRVILATWTSVGTYVLWLGCVWYAHRKGSLATSPVGLRRTGLWQGTTTMAFAFTSSSTLLLYAALKGSPQQITTKTAKFRSFKILSILSVATAILLLLPLVYFSASPNKPGMSTPSLDTPIAVLSAFTLLLRIPFLLVTTPKIRIPTAIRRLTTAAFQDGIGKVFICASVCVLALVGTLEGVGDTVVNVVNDLGLVGALLGTYMLPAIVHITTHHFKRPLSIVIPNTPLAPTFSQSSVPDFTPRSYSTTRSPTAQSPYDELLQRKERALQRRRLGRRIIWDIGVWLLLVPIGGGGIIWSVGRVIGRW